MYPVACQAYFNPAHAPFSLCCGDENSIAEGEVKMNSLSFRSEARNLNIMDRNRIKIPHMRSE